MCILLCIFSTVLIYLLLSCTVNKTPAVRAMPKVSVYNSVIICLFLAQIIIIILRKYALTWREKLY